MNRTRTFRGWLWLLVLGLGVACSHQESSAPTVPSTAGEAQPLVAGTLELDEKLKDKADPLAVIFVIARNEQGQIVAVKKLLPPFQYPLAFSLNGEDTMIQGTELSGKLKVTARLDKDGNANPPQPGDILGKTATEWVSAGDRDLKIQLNELVP